jgi:hypothetical protein
MHSSSSYRVHRSSLVAPIAIVAMVALIAAGCTQKAFSQPETTSLRLEPIGFAGASPFSPPVGTDRLGVTPPPNSGGTVVGSTAGLFGGTENVSACNPQGMVAFLQQHPDKAVAWAGVLGISPADIPAFVSGLTSVVLRSDTMVTNHGFENGHATIIAAVLQAGTAVLVDQRGLPVVKCLCGNPLTPPVPFQRATFVGTSWPLFATTTITFIQPTVDVISQFTLVEPITGASFNRPVGTDGAVDRPAAPAPVNPPAPAPPTGPPGPPVPPPAAPQQAVTASWVIAGCVVDRAGGAATLRATVLVRNNDPTSFHSYQMTVEFGPSGSYGQTTMSVVRAAPGQTQRIEVSTLTTGTVPDGTPLCAIRTIVDENGRAPAPGPALLPQPT